MAKKQIFYLIIIVVLFISGIFLIPRFLSWPQKNQKETADITNDKTSIQSSLIESKKENDENIVLKVAKKTPIKAPLPESVNLDVPFTSQAPHANWAMPWQEACEEAGLIMIHHYLQGERGGEIDKNFANEEILKMVAWQEKNWGGHYDLPAADIAKLAREYYGYKNVRVKYDITVEDIKKELAQKNPVLVPAAGRELANSYFTPPGPVYHNLVIVGYDANGFITNDPGVWQGHKFRYSFENLFDSIHDFVPGTTKTNPNPILNGKKVMIVIKQ